MVSGKTKWFLEKPKGLEKEEEKEKADDYVNDDVSVNVNVKAKVRAARQTDTHFSTKSR